MEITFQIGETQWNSNGTHILNDKGISLIYEEVTTVTFDSQEIYDLVLPLVEEERLRKQV